MGEEKGRRGEKRKSERGGAGEMMMTIITRGGEGLEDKNEDIKSRSRSRGSRSLVIRVCKGRSEDGRGKDGKHEE
jgi:hypothetical protein